jgi:CRP-like cAMP-binding protein
VKKEGDILGEIGLYSHQSRTADLISGDEHLCLGVLNRKGFDFSVREYLDKVLEEKIKFFKEIVYFADFSKSYLQLLATICENPIYYKYGEKIFKEGDSSEFLYIIVKG